MENKVNTPESVIAISDEINEDGIQRKPRILITSIAFLFICVLITIIAYNYKDKRNMFEKVDAESLLNLHNSSAYIETFPVVLSDEFVMALNTDANPCEEFLNFACDNWKKGNINAFDTVFVMKEKIWTLISEEADTLSKESLNENTVIKNNGSKLQQDHQMQSVFNIATSVSNFINSCENEHKKSVVGANPLNDLLQQWDDELNKVASSSAFDIFNHMLQYTHHELQVFPFFRLETDFGTFHTQNVTFWMMPGKFFAGEDYFKLSQQEIEMYKAYVAATLYRIGHKTKIIEKEVQLITQILNIFVKEVSQQHFFNLIKIRELKINKTQNQNNENRSKSYKGPIDWTNYFAKAFELANVSNLSIDDQIVLCPIENFLSKFSQSLTSEIVTFGTTRLMAWMRWQVIEHFSQFLSGDIRRPMEDILGAQGNIRTCKEETQQKLRMPVAFLLAQGLNRVENNSAFINETKMRFEKLVELILTETNRYLDNLNWPSTKTKQRIKEKLDNLQFQIAPPLSAINATEVSNQVNDLQLTEFEYFENNIKLQKLEYRRKLAAPFQTDSSYLWHHFSKVTDCNPQYIYSSNTVVIPMGLFMEPMYNANYPDFLNFASFGSLVAHEIMHAFDEDARQRNINGQYNYQLWSNNEEQKFAQKVSCRLNDYERYFSISPHNTNTIAEILADDASVNIASQVAQTLYEKETFVHSKNEFENPWKVFFIRYAQMFCSESPNEPPNSDYPSNKARVEATLASTKRFAESFGCSERKHSCNIW